MLLDTYKEKGLLFNVNFVEPAGSLQAYRGELIVIEGGIGDDKGHAKPPVEVMRGAVMLADEKIQMLIGAVDTLESLPVLIEKYKADFAADMSALIYVVNLQEAVVTEFEGISFILIPMVQGVPWNETMEELALEKSDFKGQSPGEKLVTMYDELKAFKPKFPTVSSEEALGMATDTVREGWGAV